MPLNRQNLTLPFATGIDTKTDSNQIPSWKMSRLENVVFSKLRQMRKRNGYTSLTKTVSSSSGLNQMQSAYALTSFKDELVCAGTASLAPSKSKLFSYSAGSEGWIDKGDYTPCAVDLQQVSRGTATKKSPNAVHTSSGLDVFVWEQSGSVMYSIVDVSSGQLIVSSAVLAASASKPRVLQFASNIIVYYVSSASIYAVLITVGSSVVVGTPVQLTSSTPGGVNTLLSSASAYDASVIDYGIGNRLYLAFSNDAGGVTVRVYDTSAIFVYTNQQTISAHSPSALAVCNYAASSLIALVSTIGSSAYFASASGALTGAFSVPVSFMTSSLGNYVSITADGIASATAATRLRVFATSKDAVTNRIKTTVASTNGTALASSLDVLGVGLVSKAWSYNSRAFAACAVVSRTTGTSFPLQNQSLVLSDETSFCDIVARAQYGTSSGLPATDGSGLALLSAPSFSTASAVIFATCETGTEIGPSGAIQTNTGITSLSVDFGAAPVSDNRTEIGGSLILGGGILSQYDGGKVVELGFNMWPDEVSVTVGGAGSLSAGSYSWVACYEWTDQQGLLHRSAPSLAATATATAGQAASVVVSNLTLTRKQTAYGRDNCQIVLYRTLANGTVYYRASSVTAPTLNSVSSFTVTIADSLSDADLASRPQLYTTGGVVENIVPAPMQGLSVHRNRLFGVDATNRLQLWYSKQITTGAPVEFSDALSMMIDNRGGDVTALASLDDKLIVFKKNLIMMISGQGPDATGGQNDFSDAMLVTSDCGCLDAKSIVTVPDGLMFQGAKGIYLLDRSLKAQYIGAEVEAYNSDAVLSAQLIPTANQVRFVMSSGVALVYDYYVSQWCVFTNHPAVDTVIWLDRFCWLRSNGTVMKEDPTRFDDDGSFVQMLATTSWIVFSTDAGGYIESTDKRYPMSLQAFQRAYRVLVLGQYINDHKLSVKVAYDFQDAYTQETVVTPPAISVYGLDEYGVETPYGGEWQLYQWRIDLARQKCQAVKVTISDIQVASSNKESVRLSALAFDLGLKPGLNRVPMSNVLG